MCFLYINIPSKWMNVNVTNMNLLTYVCMFQFACTESLHCMRLKRSNAPGKAQELQQWTEAKRSTRTPHSRARHRRLVAPAARSLRLQPREQNHTLQRDDDLNSCLWKLLEEHREEKRHKKVTAPIRTWTFYAKKIAQRAVMRFTTIVIFFGIYAVRNELYNILICWFSCECFSFMLYSFTAKVSLFAQCHYY